MTRTYVEPCQNPWKEITSYNREAGFSSGFTGAVFDPSMTATDSVCVNPSECNEKVCSRTVGLGNDIYNVVLK